MTKFYTGFLLRERVKGKVCVQFDKIYNIFFLRYSRVKRTFFRRTRGFSREGS